MINLKTNYVEKRKKKLKWKRKRLNNELAEEKRVEFSSFFLFYFLAQSKHKKIKNRCKTK